MDAESSTSSVVYRAGIHLFVIVGVFASLFATLGLFIAVKQGDWTFLAVVVCGTVVLFLLLGVLKLEISLAGFKYRNLSGTRDVAFREVSRAFFEVVSADVAPQGVAAFWVERRNGTRVKVNLRTFAVDAAAALFTALEKQGIPIEVPDHSAAQRAAAQVQEAQTKMRK